MTHLNFREEVSLATDIGRTLDTFRQDLMRLMGDADGTPAVHALLGNLVGSVDDAREALVETQLGMEFGDLSEPVV